ncbi:TlpA family protein disulfide reductase [Chloroflexota bacterium]
MSRRLQLILAMTLALTAGLLISGCSPSSEPQPPNGGSPSTYPLKIDLLGTTKEFSADSQGILKSKIEVSSADSKITLSINKGTMLLDKDGKPLQVIQASIDANPSSPHEDAFIVSPVYNLSPEGATFNPQLMLSLRYEPTKLPEGAKASELYIAYHDGIEWRVPRYRKVDTKANSVTTQVYHFTSFAILTPKQSAPPGPPAPTIGTEIGNLAPDFPFQNQDGQFTSLGELQGKPVLINFWATWCPPCRSEMPYLQEIYDEWQNKGLVVLPIDIGESTSKVKEFMQRYNLSLPVLLDSKGETAAKYNIRGLPTTFFIDKDGIIRDKVIGAFQSKAQIEEKLGKIMP